MKSGLSEIDKLSGTLESNIPSFKKKGETGKTKNSKYRCILTLKVMRFTNALIALTKSKINKTNFSAARAPGENSTQVAI